VSLSAKDQLLVMLIDAVKRGDRAQARQLKAMATATDVPAEVVDGILGLPAHDPERRLATALEVPLIGEIDGRPAPLTPAAQRVLGVGFGGTLQAAVAQIAGVSADEPDLAAFLSDARLTGAAQRTLAQGRVRAVAWTTLGGQLRVAAAWAGGDEKREIETLATVNHEMANGVTALASLAALARHPSTSADERDELLARIERTARHTLDSVQATRRAMRSHPPRELPLIDIAPQLHELLAAIEPTAIESGVRIDARIEDELHVRMRAAAVRSVAWNLIKNAVEASPRGGTVQVSAQPLGDTLRLVVRDEGAGMDEATQRRAFDPFFTTKREGSGLGLPLVKHLVERAGGKIVLDSRLGGGTRVVVTLPRTEPLSGIQPISAVQTRSPLAGLRTLAVGPEARSMAEALRSRGALLEDARETIAGGTAVDLALVGGVQGTMLIQALRPLAECLVWVGPDAPNEERLDGHLVQADVAALLALVGDLYPERLAV